jgi:hypothetical protein
MPKKALFRLTVDMQNAAFQDNPEELITILQDAIEKIKAGNQTAKLKDSNGNTVGQFTIW